MFVRRTLSLALLLLSALSLTAMAMPPHPDLVARIRAGEIAEPYYLQHRAELLSRGVDNPPPRTIDFLRQRALDEDLNILAILVDFSDNNAHTDPTYFDTLLFGAGPWTLKHYYNEVSYGNLTLLTLNMPGALGWQRAPETYRYYVDGQNGFGGYPQNAQGLAQAAVLLADPVVNFSNYDNDGDGTVDALFVVHAGPGAERTGNANHIWSHMWVMPEVHVDGVVCSVYSMEPEYWTTAGDMTCGVYAHEMGHSVFFLPDLYDYGYDSNGLGSWSLMAGGSWNGNSGRSPAHPDAQSRVQAGFVDPIRVTGSLMNIEIPPVEVAPVIYELWTGGQDNPEHFFVENRQRRGYDAALPGEGLMIYHVDELMGGNDEQWYPGSTGGHYRVALEQADGNWDLEHSRNSGDNGDPFPGMARSAAFKSSSVPNSHDYNDQDTQVAVRRIQAVGDTMLASLLVDANDYVFIEMPTTQAVSGQTTCVPVNVENDVTGRNITSFSFTLVYDPLVLAAVDPYYDLTGSIIPAGWSVSATESEPGVVEVSGSGATPLSGQGPLLCLRFAVQTTVLDEQSSELRFTEFLLAGTSPVDTTSGSLLIQAPRVSVYPPSLEFEFTAPGQTRQLSMIIRNLGHAPLRVDSLVVALPFSTDFTGPRTVDPASWTPIRVRFSPSDTLDHTETLRIFSNNPAGSVTLELFSTRALSVDEPPTAALPADFYLNQNHPNPFNPVTQFEFGLPHAAHVSLKVYDLLGREVTTLVEGRLAAGHHRALLDGSNFGTGMYLAVLQTGHTHLVRKAMLIK